MVLTVYFKSCDWWSGGRRAAQGPSACLGVQSPEHLELYGNFYIKESTHYLHQ